PKRPDPAALERAWAALAGADPAAAYRAVWDLGAGGGDAGSPLSRRLEALPARAPGRLGQLLEDPASAGFATREQAQKDLARYGDQIEGDLERLLRGKPSPEVRKRALALLAPLRRPAQGDGLRAVRAVMALERAGTPAARQALQALARGAPGA